MKNNRKPIVLTANFRALAGSAYGLHEKCIVGTIIINQQYPINFTDLDPLMNQWIETPFIEKNEAKNTAYRLIERFLFWLIAIQQQQKIPLFGQSYSKLLDQSNDQYQFQVAIPFHHIMASKITLEWLLIHLNRLIIQPDICVVQSNLIFKSLMTQLRQYALTGVNRFHLLKAAHQLKIPYQQLTDEIYSFKNRVRILGA
jgi:hypothetical protein